MGTTTLSTTSATDKFILTSDECELLLAFEGVVSLPLLAVKVGRDHSVVSRQLKRISEKMPAVEKKGGKWVLTEIGKEVNLISRSMLQAQNDLNHAHTTLRVGTNREFATRIIAPQFKKLSERFPKTTLSVSCFESGTETALLNGLIDIGIDCDRPHDPDISYKLLIDEPIVAVCNKTFYQANRKSIENDDYQKLPHLLCSRLHPDKILQKSENQMDIVGRFNDIAVTRNVCLTGLGWALLPRYAIKEELEQKELIILDKGQFAQSKYGIWWLRGRTYLKPAAQQLVQWLEHQKL